MSEPRRELDRTDAPAALEEQLVAYLDGELDAAETARVEHLLANDAKVREALMRLDRAWSLLDELDRTRLDESFTRTTLEMVAVAAEADVRQFEAELPRQRSRQWLLGGASVIAAALAGFLAILALRPNPNDQLLQDLPVLEDLDELRQIEDLEFLRAMYEEGLFAKDTANDA